MTDLRTAAQQALEALDKLYLPGELERVNAAITALRAALAQQAEPVAGRAFLERILAAMEGVIDVADRKTDEFDALRSCVIDLTVMLHAAPPQQVAQQAEPLNLSDPAVQKRLATQWGYVPAAQAEPVEPVAWECKAGGLKPLTQRQYDAQTAATKRHYTRIAPPQRQPLTEEEIIDAVRDADLDWTRGWTLDETHGNRFAALARAVEKASWEKNHG